MGKRKVLIVYTAEQKLQVKNVLLLYSFNYFIFLFTMLLNNVSEPNFLKYYLQKKTLFPGKLPLARHLRCYS